MDITWIGQSGYILDVSGIRILIDPYLSNSIYELQGLKRIFPAPVAIADLHPDYIYCTHNHLDHFDPQTILSILESFPSCKIIGPTSVIVHAAKLKINEANTILLDQHQTLVLNGLKLTATPAIHSDTFSTGLFIEDKLHRIYFSGDTEYTTELESLLMKILGTKLDLFFVCINGKLGNMNANEAANLAKALNPEITIPNHYGMFAENTADPEYFTSLCKSAGLKTKIMQVNTSIKL
jgi:L-ascorbate 6-phosphate lactonase